MFARDIRDWCGRIQVIGSLSLGYFFKVILFNLFLFKARQMSYAMTPLCYLAAKVQRIEQTTKPHPIKTDGMGLLLDYYLSYTREIS